MPRPRNERQAWEEELAELPDQIARWGRELTSLSPADRVRREMLEWMIRRDKLRIETLRRWLTQAAAGANPDGTTETTR